MEDAKDGDGEFYEASRLAKIVEKSVHHETSADAIQVAIVNDVRLFMGDLTQEDDIAIVVIRVEHKWLKPIGAA